MAENKTQPTEVDPEDFLNALDHPKRKEDGFVLLDMLKRVTGWPPVMWGPTIIGFGSYHYKYDSGREGDHLVTGFSPRKTALTLYIMPGYRDIDHLLKRLGKHKIGKACLYINKLEDVDLDVLEEIVVEGVDYMKKNYVVTERLNKG